MKKISENIFTKMMLRVFLKGSVSQTGYSDMFVYFKIETVTTEWNFYLITISFLAICN